MTFNIEVTLLYFFFILFYFLTLPPMCQLISGSLTWKHLACLEKRSALNLRKSTPSHGFIGFIHTIWLKTEKTHYIVSIVGVVSTNLKPLTWKHPNMLSKNKRKKPKQDVAKPDFQFFGVHPYNLAHFFIHYKTSIVNRRFC